MLKPKYPLLLLVALLATLLGACSSTPETKQITLIAEDIVWNIDTIRAEPGQMVEVTIRNEGVLDHNFVVEELGIEVLLSPGDIEIISFVVDEAGRLDFICSIAGHEEAGMVGEIIIGEGQ